MIDQYVLATNDDGDLAIRTVSATESSSVTDTTSVITATDDGKLAVRVVGAGGDSHNKGSFLTPEALRTAYPTAQPGDFAIVESTDTVWVWDSDTNDWKDGDTKGQVTSVNNQTGAVTLTASDVGAATAAQGAKADTAVQLGDLATVATTGAYSDLTGTPTIPAAQVNSDWNASSGVAEILNKPTLATVATSGAYSDLTGTPTIPAAIQVSTMPTAAVGELDKIYQFVGTTDANYTNGYFYKCVSDGQDPATYSWTQTDVQPQAGGLPSQTGQSGKFLTTDGTDASWSDKPLVNTATGTDSLTILGTATNQMWAVNLGAESRCQSGLSVAVGRRTKADAAGAVVIGAGSSATQSDAVAIGQTTNATGKYGIAIGSNTTVSQNNAIAIGAYSYATATNAIQLGANGTNSEAGTFCVASKYNNTNVNYKMMSADGTIPTDRFTTTPVADGTYVPTLTISSGTATRTWGAAASAPVVPATMPTLAVADWSLNSVSGKYEQAVTVQGVTSSNIILVAPAPASAADYAAAGIVCTAQGSGTLTFTCTTVPSNAITVNVVILG